MQPTQVPTSNDPPPNSGTRDDLLSSASRTKPKEFHYRLVEPDDIDRIKALCTASFPLQYADSWYQQLGTKPYKYYSLLCCDRQSTSSDQRFGDQCNIDEVIVGIIVAQIKHIRDCNADDDRPALMQLHSMFGVRKQHSCYILALAVNDRYRRMSIASTLLEKLNGHILDTDSDCGSLYLHVLDSNLGALAFYEKHEFMRLDHYDDYYVIEGQGRGGFCYAKLMHLTQAQQAHICNMLAVNNNNNNMTNYGGECSNYSIWHSSVTYDYQISENTSWPEPKSKIVDDTDVHCDLSGLAAISRSVVLDPRGRLVDNKLGFFESLVNFLRSLFSWLLR